MRRYILFILSLPVGTSYFLYHLRILLVIHLSISHLPFTNIICISRLLCVLPSVHQLSILCHIYIYEYRYNLSIFPSLLPSFHPPLPPLMHHCSVCLAVHPSIYQPTNEHTNCHTQHSHSHTPV